MFDLGDRIGAEPAAGLRDFVDLPADPDRAGSSARACTTPLAIGATALQNHFLRSMPAYSDATCGAVTIERLRRNAIGEQLARRARDAAFGLLAPARMVDGRIDVGEEPVFLRLQRVPGGFRHLLDELDAHDRLDALEPVLPRHDQPQRRAVLLRQRLAVEPGGEEGEGMHRFVDAQAFAIRPFEDARTDAGHLRRIAEGDEGDVLRLRRRLETLEHRCQRHAEPRDHHRPAFDAAQAIHALLGRQALEQIAEFEVAGLRAFAADEHAPRFGAQRLARLRRIGLAAAELVEVVVGGHVLVTREFLVGAKARLRLLGRDRHLRRRRRRRGFGATGQRQGGARGEGGKQATAIAVDRFVGDLRCGDAQGVAQGHGGFLGG